MCELCEPRYFEIDHFRECYGTLYFLYKKVQNTAIYVRKYKRGDSLKGYILCV